MVVAAVVGIYQVLVGSVDQADHSSQVVEGHKGESLDQDQMRLAVGRSLFQTVQEEVEDRNHHIDQEEDNSAMEGGREIRRDLVEEDLAKDLMEGLDCAAVGDLVEMSSMERSVMATAHCPI